MTHIHRYRSVYAGTTNERYRAGGSDIKGKRFNESPSLGSIKVSSCSALLRSGSRYVVSFNKDRATGIPYYNAIVLVSNNICNKIVYIYKLTPIRATD